MKKTKTLDSFWNNLKKFYAYSGGVIVHARVIAA